MIKHILAIVLSPPPSLSVSILRPALKCSRSILHRPHPWLTVKGHWEFGNGNWRFGRGSWRRIQTAVTLNLTVCVVSSAKAP